MAANWDDERYEELPDWDKDIYWHFFIGDQHFRLPKPFEIGLMFATLPERMIRAIGGKESGKKFAKLVAHNFMEQLAFNPIPQIALPLAENLVNYDFFSGNPIEGMADANLLSGARYDQRTSLLARQAGEQFGWSPKKIDHLITGYTGTLGAYVLGAMDIVLRGMGEYGERPALRVDELPVIKSFLRGSAAPKSTQYSEDFYRMMQQANQVYGTVQRWKREHRLQESRALQREQRHILASRPRLNRTQQQVRQLNSQIQMVQLHTGLSAEEKRHRIDRLLARRNRIVQQAVIRMHGGGGE
nr:LPD38 domain-containing protein [Edwardsiella ictaluri]